MPKKQTKSLITAEEIIACCPCDEWPHESIRSLAGTGVTSMEIATHPAVSLAHRRWALTQLLARRNPRALVRWAVDVSQDVRHLLAGNLLEARDACARTTLAWCEGGDARDVRDARAALRDALRDAQAYAAAAYATDYAARADAYAASHAADAAAAAATTADAAAAADAADYAAYAADYAARAAHAAYAAHAAKMADYLLTLAAYFEEI